jgi:DNA-binding transcriptional MerR regulator
MTNEERKEIIRRLLAEGQSLSQIQDYLRKEKNDSITYMELRLLLSEMPDAKLPEKETPKAPTPPPSAPASPIAPTSTAEPASPAGKLSISVDQLPAPGAMLSGYARFPSGAKAHWFIDEMGRLGLDPELGASKPTQADMKEFSTELRRMLQQGGGV